MRGYYQILGLTEKADKATIKRAYRELVKKYHPDVNPDPKAHRVFNKIQEAYEVLYYNKVPKTPTREPQSRSKQSTETTEQLKKRAEEARKRYESHKWEEYAKNELFFRKMTTGIAWKYFKWGSYAMATFAFLLILEYALPSHFEMDEVIAYSKDEYRGFRGGTIQLFELKEHGKLWLENAMHGRFIYSPDCYVERSWIFHHPVAVLQPFGESVYRYPIEFGMAAFFPFSLLLFCLPLLVYFYKRKNTAFSILYHLCFYFVIPLGLIYLIFGDKWAHLLTLGFL